MAEIRKTGLPKMDESQHIESPVPLQDGVSVGPGQSSGFLTAEERKAQSYMYIAKCEATRKDFLKQHKKICNSILLKLESRVTQSQEQMTRL